MSEKQKAHDYFEKGEYEQAISLYRKMAKDGCVDSKIFVGWMYEIGVGASKDEKQAEEFYKEAAAVGSFVAKFYLAKLYARRKDRPTAKIWYEKSAEQGYAPALFRVGWIYEFGKGVDIDLDKAIFYYNEAVKKEHVFAMRRLGGLLIAGYGDNSFMSRIKGGIFYM